MIYVALDGDGQASVVKDLSDEWTLPVPRLFAYLDGGFEEVYVTEDEQFEDEANNGTEVMVDIYAVERANGEVIDHFQIVWTPSREPQEP